MRLKYFVLIEILLVLALLYLCGGSQDVHVSEIEEGPHVCWEIDAETDMWRCPYWWIWKPGADKWSQDKGIDLIAKYKGRDTYCAIQAKWYAAHNTVPYDEVTNFLADSSRSEIEDRILMMSTNRLNEKTCKEVIQGQEKQVVIRDRYYFESINFNYPSHISELRKASLATCIKGVERALHPKSEIWDGEGW